MKTFYNDHPVRPEVPPLTSPEGKKLTLLERYTPLLLAHADEMQADVEETFRDVCWHLGITTAQMPKFVAAMRNQHTPLGEGLRQRRVYYFVKRWFEASLYDYSEGNQCIGVLVKRPRTTEAKRTEELRSLFMSSST